MSTNSNDVTTMIFHRWLANHQVAVLITDEAHQVQEAVQEAAGRLSKERKQDVSVYLHDKMCGFYQGSPPLDMPTDRTQFALNALQLMLDNQAGIARHNPQVKKLPFDPVKNIIFVLKDWEVELNSNPVVVQALRNMIHSNMGSNEAFIPEQGDHEDATRGKRMLVFLMTADKIPAALPELKPHIVPLPDYPVLVKAVDNVLSPLVEGKHIKKAVVDAAKVPLATALRGVTYQFAEDTMAYALARHRGLDDMKAVLETIEGEKSSFVSKIPGLSYIPKRELTPVSELPGFESAVDFVRTRMAISPEEAIKRKIQPLRGITLAGAPGTAKTRFGMAIAAEADRILLLWSLGESQGSLVGDSEANTRRAIQIAQAMHAVVLLDDVDKAGVGVATGSSHSSIEGGPFGRMIQMLLTEMSSPENKAIWVFTANRIKNLPPELIRPGRMDERFFVMRPAEGDRERIFNVHIRKRGFEPNDSMLRQLATDDFTNGWTGAEIEDLVKKGVIHALSRKSATLDYQWMTKLAARTTPMIRQAAYAEDIKEMESFCDTWEKLGVVAVGGEDKGGKARASRNTAI